MTQKTKTIIQETDGDIDPKSLALLGYRVLKLEEASKEAATAQREGVDMLSGKIDALAQGFETQTGHASDMASAKNEATLQHAILRDEINNIRDAHGSRIKKMEDERTWVIRIIVGMVITAVVGLVLVTKTGGG